MSLAKGQAEVAVELCHQSLQGFTSSSAMATLERQEIPFNLMWPPKLCGLSYVTSPPDSSCHWSVMVHDQISGAKG